MSCEYYEIGSKVRLKQQHRVVIRGTAITLPAGEVGSVMSVHRNAHELSIRLINANAVIRIKADLVSTMTAGKGKAV